MSMLQDGAIFAGRYQVIRCIAAGGMGAVYEVIHLETERRRALKVLLPQHLADEDLRRRFKQEAKVAAHIETEHIVEVFDAGYDDATRMPYLVMELLRGEELEARLRRIGRFSVSEALSYLQQTALALDKTHRASIVHRDLKPANLFLTLREDGAPRVKVLDFGVAKLIAEGATGAGVTSSVGTPLYMAPEQLANGRITPAADIFALGMLAYTFLVGSAYWSDEAGPGANLISFVMTTAAGPQEPASVRAAKRGASLPAAFDAWFAMATALRPEDRFPTATAAVDALAEALGAPRPSLGIPISGVGPLSTPDVAPSAMALSNGRITGNLTGRRRAPLLIGAAIGLGLLATVGALLLGSSSPTAVPPSQATPAGEATTALGAPSALQAPTPEISVTPAAPARDPSLAESAAPATSAKAARAAPPPLPPPPTRTVPPASPAHPTATASPKKPRYTRD